MKLDKYSTNRLVIYSFYDSEGVVDRYVLYILEEIAKSSAEILVVVNGKLTPSGEHMLHKVAGIVLIRENTGFDVWGYKDGLEYYGWNKLSIYDEIVLMNSSIMGPICPFSVMFSEMNSRNLDFWGITSHGKSVDDSFNIELGYIPTHLQSYFISIRSSMLNSSAFKNYWVNMAEVKTYKDAIVKHEAIFTKTFEDIGYKWDAYINTSDIKAKNSYPLLWKPELVLQRGCPIFKRRSFFVAKDDDVESTLLNYIREKTDYDITMINENIYRARYLEERRQSVELERAYQTEASRREDAEQRAEELDRAYQTEASRREDAEITIKNVKSGISGHIIRLLGK